ncbi:MAG: amidohydrolase family protein [Planctomycetota bacterium]
MPRELVSCILFVFLSPALDALHQRVEGDDRRALSPAAETWRQERRIIDLHMHVDASAEAIDRALPVMDAVGIGLGVNLGLGTVTRKGDEPSDFERNKALFDAHAPGRFVHYMLLDYEGWDQADWSERAVAQVEEGYRLGAAGLKEFKRLGLYLRDGAGKLIRIDDPKLDPVWQRCGELGLPVSIHVADPKAFWAPYDASNERWEELADHPNWWFGDREKYPPREELLAACNRVVERHPETTFVCVHFANNAEDIVEVGRWLERYPNMMADIAARIPELGRHPPQLVHEVFTKHAHRILFGTDFMSYDRYTLGSGGKGPAPTLQDAIDFFRKSWRWFETDDRGFAHMTPIQGRWTIDAIRLPDEVLRFIYFDNATRLLARSLPPPVARAKRIKQDFPLRADHPAWQEAPPLRLEYAALDATARPEMSTEVRLLWTQESLYLRFVCPYTLLTVFSPPKAGEREGLWERDVVEAFVGAHPARPGCYLEFEVAPNGEQLDLAIDIPHKDLAWSSGFTSKVEVDAAAQRWTAVLRVPLVAFAVPAPEPGTRWRMNLFRRDCANQASLAWRTVLRPTFHTPERFGILEFGTP